MDIPSDADAVETSSTSLQEKWDRFHRHYLDEAQSNRTPVWKVRGFDLISFVMFYEILEPPRRQKPESWRTRLFGKRRVKDAPPCEWYPQKLWFPGCGISIGPILCAAMGYNVWASDVSPVAIAYQRSHPAPDRFLASLQSQSGPQSLPKALFERVQSQNRSPGVLHFLEHDFREPFPEDHFDVVLNIRSFQIVPSSDREVVAGVHWTALRPGGIAYFDTINVGRDEDRQALEGPLAAVGFHVADTLPTDGDRQQTGKTARVVYGSG